MNPTNNNSKTPVKPVSKKIIRVTTDLEVTSYDYPTSGDVNEFFYKLIGHGCDQYECVTPVNMMNIFGIKDEVLMLIDEEGKLKGLPINIAGSWLFEPYSHLDPIVGNILLVSVEDDDFAGIPPKIFNILFDCLTAFCQGASATRRKNR